MIGLRRAVIVAAALASLGQATDLTNPADALTDTSCWTNGKVYSDPMQISPRGKQQTSAKNCAIACINMVYCDKFSWDPDSNPPGNCWLLGNSASITEADRTNVTSGPKDCTKVSGTVVTDGSASGGGASDAGGEKETGNTGNQGSAGTTAAVAGGSVAVLVAAGVGGYLYKKKRDEEDEELSGDGSSGSEA